MKKKWFFSIAYGLLLLQLVSCRKSIQEEKLTQNDETLSAAAIARAPIPTCRIEMITSWSVYDAPETLKFSYDGKNNPVRVERNHPGTGRPHLYFAYDNQGRLSDYYGPYQTDPNTGYEFWFKYLYDQSGRVLLDTQYLFGNIVDGIPQPNPAYQSAGHYEYDKLGRISKITRTMVLQSGTSFPASVETYSYDINGNLVGVGPYDNRTSFYQANKIWQFIARNYSVNNPTFAEKYNNMGYPTRFRTETPAFFSFANQLDLHDSEITYKCPF